MRQSWTSAQRRAAIADKEISIHLDLDRFLRWWYNMHNLEYSVPNGLTGALSQARKCVMEGCFFGPTICKNMHMDDLILSGSEGVAAMIAKQEERNRNEQAYEDAARRLHLLSLPSRLRIVDVLRRREECVCALQKALDRPQPYVSQQLRVLHKAGIIERRRGGHREGGDERYVYYWLADPRVRRLAEAALGSTDPLTRPETCPPAREGRENAAG